MLGELIEYRDFIYKCYLEACEGAQQTLLEFPKSYNQYRVEAEAYWMVYRDLRQITTMANLKGEESDYA